MPSSHKRRAWMPATSFEHVGLDAEAIERGLEAGVDFVRAQSARRVDVGEAGDGDVLEQHGRCLAGSEAGLWSECSAYGSVLLVRGARQDTGFTAAAHGSGQSPGRERPEDS